MINLQELGRQEEEGEKVSEKELIEVESHISVAILEDGDGERGAGS